MTRAEIKMKVGQDEVVRKYCKMPRLRANRGPIGSTFINLWANYRAAERPTRCEENEDLEDISFGILISDAAGNSLCFLREST
jgi:hypothetical protein